MKPRKCGFSARLNLALSVMAVTAPAALPVEKPQADGQASPRPHGYVHLAVVGFEADADIDPRDAWLAVGVEETLAWRLQRTPTLITIPTVRAYQGRRELKEGGAEEPTWPRVAGLLGGQVYLTGTCGGRPDAVRLNLKLVRLDGKSVPAETTTIGPVGLFEALDQATRWVYTRLNVPALDEQRERLIFAPPCRSPNALEYYAKAVAASRSDNLRDTLYYASQALNSDGQYRPALGLLAQIDLRRGPRAREAAGARLHALTTLARRTGDARSLAGAELARGLMLNVSGAFDAALEHYESALLIAYESGNPYGQVAAMDSICDVYLSRRPPPGLELTEEQQRQFRQQNYRHAAEWQRLVLKALAELGDALAEMPAASKLALIYQDLGDDAGALEMHRRTVAAAQRCDSRRSQATAWFLLGKFHRERQRWQEALEASTRCLALAGEKSKPLVRLLLASIYQALEQWTEALGQYELALVWFRETKELESQLVCLREIATARKQLGERDAALRALQEALDIANALRSPEAQMLKQRLGEWKSELK